MSNELVSFKGTREGIHIILEDQIAFDQLLAELLQKLDENRRFFAGASVVLQCGERQLSPYEEKELASILRDQYGLAVLRIVGKEQLIRKDPVSTLQTLFVPRTVRSGQMIDFEGHVIILGDLNAGAQVRAVGNICVLGALRGVAHAGIDGDRAAFVAANSFAASNVQLRIADLIVRGPEEAKAEGRVPGPEFAMVVDDNIVVHSLSGGYQKEE